MHFSEISMTPSDIHFPVTSSFLKTLESSTAILKSVLLTRFHTSDTSPFTSVLDVDAHVVSPPSVRQQSVVCDTYWSGQHQSEILWFFIRRQFRCSILRVMRVIDMIHIFQLLGSFLKDRRLLFTFRHLALKWLCICQLSLKSLVNYSSYFVLHRKSRSSEKTYDIWIVASLTES